MDISDLCTQKLCAKANVGDAVQLSCGGKLELLENFTAYFGNFDTTTTASGKLLESQCELNVATTTAAAINQATNSLCPTMVTTVSAHICFRNGFYFDVLLYVSLLF